MDTEDPCRDVGKGRFTWFQRLDDVCSQYERFSQRISSLSHLHREKKIYQQNSTIPSMNSQNYWLQGWEKAFRLHARIDTFSLSLLYLFFSSRNNN